MAAEGAAQTESATPVKAAMAIAVVALAIGGAAAVLVFDDAGTDRANADAVEQVPEDVDTITRVDPGVLEDPVIERLYAGTADRIAEKASEVRNQTVGGGDGLGSDERSGVDGWGQETDTAPMPDTDAGPVVGTGGLGPDEDSPFPTTLAELRERISNESGLDPTAADEIVYFQRRESGTSSSLGSGTEPEAFQSSRPYQAAIVHADWDEETLVEDVGNASDRPYENVTIRGATVYRPVEGEGASPFASNPTWFAVLDDGEFAVGSPNAVNDTIDVARGTDASVGGDLRDAYDRVRDGFVTSATRSPTLDAALLNATNDGGSGFDAAKYVEAYNDLHVTASSTYTTSNGIGSEQVVLTNSTETALDVESLYTGFVAIQAGAIQNETIEELLRSIDVQRDGTAVTVSREVSVETALEIVDWFLSLVPAETPAMGPGGVPAGPSVPTGPTGGFGTA